MKRCHILFALLLCLLCTGCQSQNNPETESAGNTIDLNEEIVVTTPASSTAAEETTTVPETETSAETTASQTTQTEVTTLASETTVTSETIPFPTLPAGEGSVPELLGCWEYEEGYQMEFYENQKVIVRLDYSGVMHFEQDAFLFDGTYHGTAIIGDQVQVMIDGEPYLYMTAQEGADLETLNGRFKLEECTLLESLSMPEETFYVRLLGNAFWLETEADYVLNGDTLWMQKASSQVNMGCSISEDMLLLSSFDSEGNTVHETLTRTDAY